MTGKFHKLLKTHIEKMPVFSLAIISMKTKQLNHSCHYVDENKGSYLKHWRVACGEMGKL
jgi:hypothetical protein